MTSNGIRLVSHVLPGNHHHSLITALVDSVPKWLLPFSEGDLGHCGMRDSRQL
jgi:hypothetical protein